MTQFDLRENVPLAPLTTLKVGGAARFFAQAGTEADVSEAVRFAKRENLPLFVLGGGSNVLISDAGFDGLVIQIALRGLEFREDKTGVLVTAQAGEDWEEFVRVCVERNLAGIECLSGIPGTIGGTPVQNVGAYGQEVSETIVSVRVLERESGEIFELSNEDCKFAYRTSIFNTTQRDKFIVLAVTFCLHPGGKPAVRYKDLQNYFAESDARPTLKQVREAVLEIRAAKSMVIRPEDPNSKSAGSFFKNPVVAAEKFKEIETAARRLNLIEAGKNVPHFPGGENKIKIPAAWLIEKSGFHKGYRCGRVGLSSNHTLALVNLGGAESRDVLILMRKIQARVEELFGVQLLPEPVFVGEF